MSAREWGEAVVTLFGPVVLAAVIVLGAHAVSGAQLPVLPVYLGVVLAQFVGLGLRARARRALREVAR